MPAILFGIGAILITVALYIKTVFNNNTTMSLTFIVSFVCWILAIIVAANEKRKTDKKFDSLINEVKGLRKDLTNKGGNNDSPNNKRNTSL
jgi:hypothetical protein